MSLDEEEVLIRDDSVLLHDVNAGTSPRPNTWRSKMAKTACLSLAFFALGLCIAIPGPTLLDLGDQVNASTLEMMMVLASRSVGYLVGAVVGGVLFDCFDKQLLLFNTLLISSVATVAIPWSLTLVVMATMFALQGLTMGALDTGGNIFCVRIWGKKNGSYLQTIHFAFGIGAFIAPLLATPFLSNSASNTTQIIQGNIPVSPFLHKQMNLTRSGRSEHQLMVDFSKFGDSFKRHRRESDTNLLNSTGKLDRVIDTSVSINNDTTTKSSSIDITKSPVKSDSVTKPAVITTSSSSLNEHTVSSQLSPAVENSQQNKTDSSASTSSTDDTEDDFPKSSRPKPGAATDNKLDKNFADGSKTNQVKENIKNNAVDTHEGEGQKISSDKIDSVPDENIAHNTSTTPTVTASSLINQTLIKSDNNNGSSKPVSVTSKVNDEIILANVTPTSVLNPSTAAQNGNVTGPRSVEDITQPTTAHAETKMPPPVTQLNTTTTTQTITTTPKPTTTTSTPKPTTTSTQKPTTTEKTTTTTTQASTTTTTTTKEVTTTAQKPMTSKPITTTTQKPTSAPVPVTYSAAVPSKTKIPNRDESGKENIPNVTPKPSDKGEGSTAGHVSNNIPTVSSVEVSKPNTSTSSPTTTTRVPQKPTTAGNIFQSAVKAVKGMSKIQFAYLIVGLVLFVNAIMFLVLYCKGKRRFWTVPEQDEYSHVKNEGTCFQGTLVSLLGLFLFCYIGIEVTYGALVSSFAIEFNQWPKTQGATVAAIFWGSLAVGRGFSIFLARCVGPTIMLVIDMFLMVIGGLVLSIGIYYYIKLLWLGTLILGLGMSSAFPAAISWAEKYFNLTGKATAVFIVGSALGQIVIPVVTGYLYEQDDGMDLMKVTLGLSVIALVIFVFMQCFAVKLSGKFTVRDRNGFLPLEDEEEDNMEMDLVHFDRTELKQRNGKRTRGNAEYQTLISDLDDD